MKRIHTYRSLAALTIIAFANSLSYGQIEESIDPKLEEISGEYAECAAFYRLVFYALEKADENETAAIYREAENSAMLAALIFAQFGRDKSLALTVTNSRIEIYMKQMKAKIGNRNENISILANEHSANCNLLLNALK